MQPMYRKILHEPSSKTQADICCSSDEITPASPPPIAVVHCMLPLLNVGLINDTQIVHSNPLK